MSEVLIGIAKPRLLAAVRRQATPGTIVRLIRGSDVWDLMKARGIASTGHNVVVYRDEPGRDLMHSPGGVPVDIGAEITAPFDSDSALICTTTPAGRFISALHIGPYDKLGETYGLLLAAKRAQNLQFAGPYWEYYGHWNDDPEQLETTVCYALRD